jgi:hypothetical protein
LALSLKISAERTAGSGSERRSAVSRQRTC